MQGIAAGKKEKIERGGKGGGGGCAQQGRATVKGRERGVIVGAGMRLGLGVGYSEERKEACLHKIETVM